MKRYYLLITLLLISHLIFSQAPSSFNYQTLVRDGEGNTLSNLTVNFKMSIVKTSPEGEIIYAEIHQQITNNFGLASLKIGTGNPISGSFDLIDWPDGIYYLKTEITTNDRKNYELLGITQLVSVPYSLYAKQSGLKNLPVFSQSQIDTLSAIAGATVLNSTTDCINYFTGTSWMEMCGNCSPQPTQPSAGPDQVIVGAETVLEGNNPQIGNGIWEILSGTGGQLAEPANPGSSFLGIQENSYQLSWTISNNCASNSDEVMISFVNEPPPPVEGLIFAPYVDCLLWPNYDISNIDTSGICNYTCAFIVDNQFEPGASPCWGGYQTLGMEYYQDKIASLREQGGDIIMAFGGATGVELAYAAADEFEARDAYKTVIDAYSLTSIDFDIEGFLIAEPISRERRSKAMKLLQNEYPYLQISLTLPVMPTGLTNDGINTVKNAIDNDVELHCVNIMAMDYGPSGIDMGDAAISAGNALFDQLKTLYQNAGINLADSVIWKKIGITPMIGENDVPGEIFYLDDATDLANWAAEKKIGLLSMWSANRDNECENPNDPLYSCSRIEQELFEFSGIFGTVANNPCEQQDK